MSKEELKSIPVLLPLYWSNCSVSRKERNGMTEMVEVFSRQVAKRKMQVREYGQGIKEELGIMYTSKKYDKIHVKRNGQNILTSYGPCTVLQLVYKPTRCTNSCNSL